MSIALLTILVLSVGAVTYGLSKAFVRSVRVAGTCILMLSLAAVIMRSREIIYLHRNFFDFSDSGTPSVPHPTPETGPAVDITFQGLSKEDHNFLDTIFQKQGEDGRQQVTVAPAEVQNSGKSRLRTGHESPMKAELVMNTAETKRSELSTRRETVKRAQLVTHDETFRRAELVRSRQQ
jgi:hypothetical protein